jgi:putative membrane protein insertion efficiency factor
MKLIFSSLISLYQLALSPILKNILGTTRFCRFNLTCSDYAILAINKHGTIKGSWLALKRLFSCQPFGKTYVGTV